jgi:hypothetical protein
LILQTVLMTNRDPDDCRVFQLMGGVKRHKPGA